MIGTITREQEITIQRNCVRILWEKSSGTGFFVSSTQVVTCAHVVGAAGTIVRLVADQLECFAEVTATTDASYPDVAILTIATSDCHDFPAGLPLFDDCRPEDSCYSFGYSGQNESDPVTFSIEGIAGVVAPNIKFSEGQIRPGMSGSPVFNLRTMAVCGIIHETRDRSSDLGGWALPISILFSHFPTIANTPSFSDWTLSPFHYYASTFVAQYEDHSLSASQNPIVRPIFHSNLSKLYVSPSCVDSEGHSKGSVDRALEHWRRNYSSKYLVLLGEYGSGKTAACLRLCHAMLRANVALIPLFLSIGDIAGPRIAGDTLLAMFRDQYRMPLSIKGDLVDILERYDVMLIIDGFDEMAGSLESAVIRDKLKDLALLLIPAKKVLITCRTTLFPTKQDLDYVFPLQSDDTQFLDDFLSGSHFDTLFLSDYAEPEIRQYLKVVDPVGYQAVLDAIMERYDLLDLAGRPLLLSMIARTINNLVKGPGNKITTATIYEKFTSWWLKHESAKSSLTADRKLRILESLAVRLHKDNDTNIERGALIELLAVSASNTVAISGAAHLDVIEHDFVNASFLTRTIDGHFGFSHRSFLEFFASGLLLRCFDQQGTTEPLGSIVLSGGVLKFLVERIAASKQKLSIIDMLSEWIEDTSDRISGPHLFANIATLLTWLGSRLDGQLMRDRDLQQADLRDGSFRGADLRRCCFDNCNLARADFAAADLRDASFRNAFFQDTSFHGADLRGANFWNLRIVGGPESLWCATFLGSWETVAIGTGSGLLIIFSNRGDAWEEQQRIRITETGILHMSVDRSGGRIVVTDRDTNIRIFRVADLLDRITTPLRVFSGGHDNIRWVEFSPNGRVLVTAGRDNRVRVWSLADRLSVKEVVCHKGPVMQASWSADGKMLASIGYDGNVFLNMMDGEKPVVLRDRKEKEVRAGIGRALAFNHESRLLASGGEDCRVRIWDISMPGRPQLIERFDSNSSIFVLEWIRPELLVGGTADGTIVFLGLDNGRVISHRAVHAHNDVMRSIKSWPGEKDLIMISASWDGSVKYWRGSDSRSLCSYEVCPAFRESGDTYGGLRELFADAKMGGVNGLPMYLRSYLLGTEVSGF